MPLVEYPQEEFDHREGGVFLRAHHLFRAKFIHSLAVLLYPQPDDFKLARRI